MRLQAQKCWHLQKLERGLEQHPSRAPAGTSPVGIWILDFWPPDLWEHEILLFEDTQFYK